MQAKESVTQVHAVALRATATSKSASNSECTCQDESQAQAQKHAQLVGPSAPGHGVGRHGAAGAQEGSVKMEIFLPGQHYSLKPTKASRKRCRSSAAGARHWPPAHDAIRVLIGIPISGLRGQVKFGLCPGFEARPAAHCVRNHASSRHDCFSARHVRPEPPPGSRPRGGGPGREQRAWPRSRQEDPSLSEDTGRLDGAGAPGGIWRPPVPAPAPVATVGVCWLAKRGILCWPQLVVCVGS